MENIIKDFEYTIIYYNILDIHLLTKPKNDSVRYENCELISDLLVKSYSTHPIDNLFDLFKDEFLP